MRGARVVFGCEAESKNRDSPPTTSDRPVRSQAQVHQTRTRALDAVALSGRTANRRENGRSSSTIGRFHIEIRPLRIAVDIDPPPLRLEDHLPRGGQMLRLLQRGLFALLRRSEYPVSRITRVLYPDYGLALLRRAALLARKLVR